MGKRLDGQLQNRFNVGLCGRALRSFAHASLTTIGIPTHDESGHKYGLKTRLEVYDYMVAKYSYSAQFKKSTANSNAVNS